MKLILVDPKQVEMAPYQDIPHLLTPVIVEPEKTMSALKWAVNEMERRYSLLAEERVRDIKTYNERAKAKGKKIGVADEKGNVQQVDEGTMPYIVIVIDEMADLMMILRLCRRAQWEIWEMARLMLAACRAVAPVIFRRAGPSCLFGPCTEARPCERPYKDMEDLLAIEKN